MELGPRVSRLKDLARVAAQNPEVQRRVGSGLGELLAQNPGTRAFVMKLRQQRLDAEMVTTNNRGCAFRVVKTGVEMLPFGLGLYGVGDLITFVEGVFGWEMFGRRLDPTDRVISLVAAAIPGVPATPFREAARWIRTNIEESVARVDETLRID